MSDVMTAKDPLASLTAHIVSAYVGNHVLPITELPDLIAKVHLALMRLDEASTAPDAAAKPVPAVSIRKSVQDDYLISLEDGRKFKSLKRHLLTTYGMTPEVYRAKWGLPSDYPMVAPGYAAKRSELAKSFGLGQLRKNASVSRVQEEALSEATASATKTSKRKSASVGRKPRSKAKQSAEAAE